jgi:hypothetical protein
MSLGWDRDDNQNFKDRKSIDRIDNSIGYFPGNIQIITVSENSLKRNKNNNCFKTMYFSNIDELKTFIQTYENANISEIQLKIK